MAPTMISMIPVLPKTTMKQQPSAPKKLTADEAADLLACGFEWLKYQMDVPINDVPTVCHIRHITVVQLNLSQRQQELHSYMPLFDAFGSEIHTVLMQLVVAVIGGLYKTSIVAH